MISNNFRRTLLFLLFTTGLFSAPHLYRQDSSRSGKSSGTLPLPLQIAFQKSFAGASFAGAPVKCGAYLFVGSRDNKLYLLDPFSGALIATVPAKSWVDSPPACEGSVVYFGDRAGNFYAYDAEKKTLLFSLSTGSDLLSSPLLSGGNIYLTTGAPNPRLLILDKSGAILASLSLPQPSLSSPVETSSGVLVAVNTGKYFLVQNGALQPLFDSQGETNFFTPFAEASTTYALGSDYGAKLFKIALPEGSVLASNLFLDSSVVVKPSALADGGDRLFLSAGTLPASSPTKRQVLYAFDKGTLSLLFQKELSLYNEWLTVSSPLVVDGKVLIGTFEGHFLVLDGANGATLQDLPLDSAGIQAAPLYSQGMVYVVTLSGTVVGLRVASSDPKPVVALTSPANGAKVGGTFTVRGTASDDHLKSYTLELASGGKPFKTITDYESVSGGDLGALNVSGLPDGSYTLTLSAEDIVGNSSQASLSLTLDTTPPELTVTAPKEGAFVSAPQLLVQGTSDGVSVTVNGVSASLSQGKFQATISLSEGQNPITIEAKDEVGNVAQVVRQVTLDTKPPALVVSEPTEGAITNQGSLDLLGKTEPLVSLTLNGKSIPVGSDGSFSPTVSLQIGSNALELAAEDQAGNKTLLVRKVTYDPNAPSLSVTSPSEGETVKSASLLLVGKTEPGASVTVAKKGVSVDASGNFSATVSLTEGKNTISVVAKDEAGNQSEVLRTVVLDTIAPKLTVAEPRDGFLVNQVKLLVKGSTELGSSVTVNGASAPVGADGSFSLQLSLKEGENHLEIVALDAAGNQTVVKLNGTLDTIPPPLSILSSPSGGLTNRPSITLSGATESGAALSVNGLSERVLADGSFAFSWTLQEGLNSLLFVAQDKAGNETEKVWTVTLDTIPPEGSLAIQKSPFGLEGSTQLKVQVLGSDQGSGVDHLLLSESSNFSKAQTFPFSKSPQDLLFTFSREGHQTLYGKLVDRAGNESKVFQDSVLIDTSSFLMVPLDLAKGGVFKTKDGTELQIPERALKLKEKAATSYLVILNPLLLQRKVADPKESDFRATDWVREIFVSDENGKELSVAMEKPLSLTFSYAAATLPSGVNPKNLRLTSYNGTHYEVLEGEQKVDSVKKELSAELSHFSLFRLLEVRVNQKNFIAELYNYPNPFSGREGAMVTYKLKGDAQDVSLEVFTASGGKIVNQLIPAHAKGSLIGRNRFKFKPAGMEQFANGVYFLRVVATDSQGKRHSAIFKSVILR